VIRPFPRFSPFPRFPHERVRAGRVHGRCKQSRENSRKFSIPSGAVLPKDIRLSCDVMFISGGNENGWPVD
jgi:hypothetical protein